MAELQVTSSQLRSKAEEIRNLGQEINSSLENLRETEGALAGMWEGEAQTTFRSAFNTSATQMETYKSAIESYAQTLEEIAEQYERAEATNTSTATVN